MELHGITLDFYDKRTCGLLPDLCLRWDIRYDELEDNEELLNYWEEKINKVLSQTKKVVYVNTNGKSLVYSADEEAIKIISKEFKDLQLQKIDYADIIACENCVSHNYLSS